MFQLVSTRKDTHCNFIDAAKNIIPPNRIIYRAYATLYFVLVTDQSESELAVLDLIQVIVEVLDKSFENVCELDLIFNPDKVIILLIFKLNYILDEIVMDGMVLETAISEILGAVED